MSSKYTKPQTRFLLGLVRQLLQDRPGLTGSDVARELNLSKSGGRYYLAMARRGVELPDPNDLALDYMLQHPHAAVRDLAEHLGVSRSVAQRLRATARAKMLETAAATLLRPRQAPDQPAHSYPVQKFKDLK